MTSGRSRLSAITLCAVLCTGLRLRGRFGSRSRRAAPGADAVPATGDKAAKPGAWEASRFAIG